MRLAEINEVIKASPAIQIQSKITHLQRRAWNILLANAYNELPDKEVHVVSIAELAAKLGFDSNNHDHLKAMLRSLRNCEVEWNILGKDKKQEWGVAGLLAEARIRDGICFYQFSHTLRQKLYNPSVYAKLNLHLQNQFKSQYALILWEICFDYFDTKRGVGETPFISLDTFKSLMGLGETDYPEFKILSRDLIKVAIKEINDLTDYHVEVEYKRITRKVAELKFRIEKVKEISVQESIYPDIEDLPTVAVELVQADVNRPVAQKIASQEWEYVNPDKLPDPGTYADFAAYVSEKIEMSLDVAGMKNRAGYIIKAIRENYQNHEVRKAREIRAEKIKEKALEDLQTEFNAKRATILRQSIHAEPELIEQAAERITIPFVLKRLNEYDSVKEAYDESGLVKAQIDQMIIDAFCQEQMAPVIAAFEAEKAKILGRAQD
ncbi:MAG: replication initiation protein [Candidatus Poribacteria bacterium]|nr:replication initiation protein [Candidatus Poribacteria bacterium]